MIRILIKGVIICTLFSSLSFALVFDNAFLLNDEVKNKITLIGNELFEKTKVRVDLLTVENKDNTSLRELSKEHISKLQAPYVVLVLSPKKLNQDSGKVDIFLSHEDLLDKESVLSSHPQTGSIIPILVGKKAKDIYNAALLNGYADIADRIADKHEVVLENSIGNSNKIALNVIRYPLYATIILVILFIVYRSYFGKK